MMRAPYCTQRHPARGRSGHGRPLSWLAALMTLFFLSTTANAQVTVTSRVNTAHDDMEEIISTGAIDDASSDLELVSEGAGDQIIGLRFTNLTIPQGAVILNATIQFTVDETSNGATALTLRAQAADNAATFAVATNSVSGRPLTTASVAWTVNPWNTLQEQGADQRTPNLKSIIQEVVDRAGWASGNAIAVIVTGSGKRVAESYEGATAGSAGHSANQAAGITIEYIVPTTINVRVNASTDDAEENVTSGAIDITSTDLELTEDAAQQYIGMRFNGVSIPKGAVIASAHIQFATDELFSNATSLTIRGEASDNPGTFTSTPSSISARPTTAAGVAWSPSPWTLLQEAGPLQRTPNLSAVVQEIVDRAGWSQFNSMVMRVNGTGRRTAEAFDGSAAEAPLLVVKYYTLVPPVAPTGVFPVAKNAVWKYLDDGSDQGTAWRAAAFNDASWKFGPAQLGYGDNDEATVVSFGPSSSNKPYTTYFRHTFNVTNPITFDSLKISLMRDDGAVVYLNGVEILRSNMPATGPIGYQTPASANVGGADESTYYTYTVGKQNLVMGSNVLAVEIHQDVPTSSDLSFNFEMVGKKNDVRLVTSGSTWEYKDDGGLPRANWYQTSFDDASWRYGASPLGYGNDGEKTVVGYGPDALNKYPATYFRRTFTVNDTVGFNSLLLRLRRDDGAIVYLNGTELLRSNMPTGAVTNTTYANGFIEGYEEEEFLQYYISRNLIRPGSNLVAVEVHQNSPKSSDLAFDLEMVLSELTVAASTVPKGSLAECNPLYPPQIGCFTSVTPAAQTQPLVYPRETHTFQRILTSGVDKYTGTNTLVPQGNDFTGYVPKGGSSTLGHVSVNHENNPGGVSVLDIHYDFASGLWKVDTITKVDFSGIVTTERNCSGTVTPWGSIITCEETFSTGDVNGDGYHDRGWNVEIDAETGLIRDYDGDSKPDKLWMVGRMNHENVVVSNDRVTLYQGEDGGTGCVYKFVAARPMRLDSGTLYVLKRDNPTATTGTWVRVPNATKTDRNNVSTVAGSIGGTRFGGVEDVEIGPIDGKIYFTEKGRGDVWRFTDNGTTVSNLEVFISNQQYSITHTAGVSNESWGSGADNLAFDAEGNLWVCQDGGRNHFWMAHADHTPAKPHISLFATTPAGSEPTGITFSPDHRFMFLSFQHPAGSNTVSQKDATGKDIVFNNASTIVVARKEHLGAGAINPVVNLGDDRMICDGNAVTLKYVNRNAQSVWSNGSVDSLLRVTESGIYSIAVYGNNGRNSYDTVRVEFLPYPTVELGADRTICAGEIVNLSLDTMLAYDWSDGQIGASRSFNRAGTYFVRGINAAGCFDYDTINITLNQAPRPNLGADVTICRGSTASITPGAGFSSYQWNSGSEAPSLTVSTPGLYWVKVTNENGCAAYDTVNVSLSMAADLGADLSLCEGNSILLNPGTGFADYRWSDGTRNRTLRADKPGTYWVETTDGLGCSSIDTVVVAAAPKAILDLGRDTLLCAGCSLVLDAGAGFSSYQWSNGATTRTITVTQGGFYSVTVRNSSGCYGEDDIEVFTDDVVTGVDEVLENEKFSLGAYPNPFGSELSVAVTLKSRERLQIRVYDPAGREVATLADEVRDAGRHLYTFDAAAAGAQSGVYVVKVSAGGRQLSRKVVRR